MAERPNFLIIMTDQHRAEHLGCGWRSQPWREAMGLGRGVLQTPNLDRLAAEGVHFARAYVNNPLCMPGRSTLLTGRTPRGHGVRTNGIDLAYDVPTMPEAVRQAGYRTHYVGKIHARNYGLPRGADPESLDPTQHPESAWMWTKEKMDAGRMPRPYFGFETTEMTVGHVSYTSGEYLHWLRRAHPGAERLLLPEASKPSRTGAEQTFTMAIPPGLHYNTWCADRTIAFLEQTATEARNGRPFMVWCSFPDPHHPFAAPEPFASMYDPADVSMPVRRDGELDDLPPHMRRMYEHRQPTSGRFDPTRMRDDQLREIIAMTYGMLAFVDQQVGRVLDSLDRLGLAENTVVVFMSDHGDLMGDHWLINKGPFHFDGLLRVPLIYRWPGHFPAGTTVNSLASHLDFAPTILDLAGVPIPEGHVPPRAETERAFRPWPGYSLTPILTGQSSRVRDAVLVENDEDYIGLRLRTIITNRHQLTVYVGDEGEEPYGELFDMENDPGQLHSLWTCPEAQEVKPKLRDRLLAEIIRTDCPLPRRMTHA